MLPTDVIDVMSDATNALNKVVPKLRLAHVDDVTVAIVETVAFRLGVVLANHSDAN